jgi:hypothetical protein
MKDHMSDIIIGVIGITTTATAWFLGGKQRSKNDKDDTLTKGANQIVETSNNLLSTIRGYWAEEREHRISCEEALRKSDQRIDELERKLEQLENIIK